MSYETALAIILSICGIGILGCLAAFYIHLRRESEDLYRERIARAARGDDANG